MESDLERGLRTQRHLAIVCYITIGLAALAFLYNIYAIHYVLNSGLWQGSPEDVAWATRSDLAVLVSYLLSATCVAIWIYIAHKNLTRAGYEALEFTQGWSVGWFFVPFANLVMPYRAMRELWDVSVSREGFGILLMTWWFTFLTGGALAYIAQRLVSGPLIIASLALRIVSAILLLVIIYRVTKAQSDKSHIGELFS